MVDLFEDSNNDFNEYPSFNNSFMENNDGYFGEEKNTSFATTNQLNNENYENSAPYIKEFPCHLYDLYIENENNEKDIENSFLNKNTKRDEDIKYENKISNKNNCVNIFNVENKIRKNEELSNIKDKKLKNEENQKGNQSNLGRKKQESGEIGQHNKSSKDNIINKIKTSIFNDYIRNIVKENSLKKDIDLKKLPTKGFISDLSKINNERLFDMKIKDILCEQPVSTKYSKFNRFENKKIIDKIYEEKKEINVIKILELTFEELLIIYRRKLKAPEDKEELEKIKAKIEGLDLLEENENKYKDIGYLIKKLEKDHEKEYIEEVKTSCLGYINWFSKKFERKSD